MGKGLEGAGEFVVLVVVVSGLDVVATEDLYFAERGILLPLWTTVSSWAMSSEVGLR